MFSSFSRSERMRSIRQKQTYRLFNLGLVARSNLSVFAFFLFAFALATLLSLMIWYEASTFTPTVKEIARVDFFINGSSRSLFGLFFTPLSLVFMLYCVRNDFLAPRVIRFKHIESFWFIQVAKALLAALCFAVIITLSVFFLSLSLAEIDANFDSTNSLLYLGSGSTFTNNPSLFQVIFVFFSYTFLTLSLVNLVWLLLDAIFPKRWIAFIVSIALGILGVFLSNPLLVFTLRGSVAFPVLITLGDIRYPQWFPGASFGFEYLIPAVLVVITVGALFYRVRGCPRAVY